MDEPTTIHADLDAFFASVEQRDDPSLRGKPVIVGGGVVQAASYEARAQGVRSAMGGRRARELCPDAIVVPPRWSAYVEASKAVFEVFRENAPVVEGISIDEAFLDVRGLEHIRGSPRGLAIRLKREVAERVGLPLSVGLAATKFLAKVASAAAKPDGLLVVERGRELSFLHPLAIECLWGVGPKTSEKLRGRGIETVAQVAALAEAELVEMLGRAQGRHLHALAHNRDPRRVRRTPRRRSVGAQSALSPRRRAPGSLDATLNGLVDRVTRRMRSAGREGRGVTLRLRFADYSRATRSRTMATATSSSATILAVARHLLDGAMPLIERRGISLLGIAVTGLNSGGSVQLELPIDDASRRRALDLALDSVRDRFGPSAVTRASLLGRDPGLAAWLMPNEGE